MITISTTIAQLLIKGGTVDILTSSEVLAERDAEESKPMFEIFDINVSCNCDEEANANEKVRKERYEKNSVIYGEIGHFQRDILLTKYYEKDIRKQLAKCLIVDEVDSMCNGHNYAWNLRVITEQTICQPYKEPYFFGHIRSRFHGRTYMELARHT